MDKRSYVFRVWLRAWKMTREDLGVENIKRTIVRVLMVGVAVFILYAAGLFDLVKDRIGEIWAAVIAFIVVGLFLFLINFFSAPAKLQSEAEEEIERLQRCIENKDARQNAVDKLWSLRSQGISLRNQPVASVAGYKHWSDAFHDWRSKVLDDAGNVSVNLKNWLERLDRTGPAPDGLEYVNNEHKLDVRNMSEILARIQAYLERELFLDRGE